MAAMLGAAPLAIGFGEGAELRRPLGITIVGGLIVSQLATLYTTPVIYLYLDRLRLWARRPRQARESYPVSGRVVETGRVSSPTPLRAPDCTITAGVQNTEPGPRAGALGRSKVAG